MRDIEQAGGAALAVQAEMADERSIVRLFETVDKAFGRLRRWSTMLALPAPSRGSTRSRRRRWTMSWR